MIKEHDRVVLTEDVAQSGLQAGDVGTVIHIYQDRAGYEVEFFTLAGGTFVVASVNANQVRAVTSNELTHTRPVAAVA